MQSGCAATINMMNSADAGQFRDIALIGRINSPRCRCIFLQRQVCPVLMIIAEIVSKHSAQMLLVQGDDVIQNVAPDAADYPFDERILPVCCADHGAIGRQGI